MSLRPRTRLRAAAAGSIIAITAGSAVVLGTAQPASAATLNFDCTLPTGAQTFPVDITSTAPATLPTGSTTAPDVTTVLTIPADLADLLRAVFGATEFSGVIHSTTLVDGVEQLVELAVPTTPAGDPGTAIPVEATGTLAPIPAGDPGDVITLAAGAQDVVMTLVGAGGATTELPIPCTPSADQDTTLDTISVVKDGSSTAAKASYSARMHKVSSSATVTSAHGIVPVSGKVKFVLKRGTHKVAAVTKDLAGGKASAAFTSVRKAGSYSVTATYLGSDLLKGSKDKVGFRVR